MPQPVEPFSWLIVDPPLPMIMPVIDCGQRILKMCFSDDGRENFAWDWPLS